MAVKGKTRRQDPRPRHIDPVSPLFLLDNPDPDKHYVYANPSAPMDYAKYQIMGYEVEELREGGVKPRGGTTCKIGEPIHVMDVVLMSISKAKWQEIQKHGWDSVSGQKGADPLEKRMITKRGGVDKLRGIYGLRVEETNAEDDAHLDGPGIQI